MSFKDIIEEDPFCQFVDKLSSAGIQIFVSDCLDPGDAFLMGDIEISDKPPRDGISFRNGDKWISMSAVRIKNMGTGKEVPDQEGICCHEG